VVWTVLFLVAFRECTREIEGILTTRRLHPRDYTRWRHYIAGLLFSSGAMLLALAEWKFPSLRVVGLTLAAGGFIGGVTVPCSVHWITYNPVLFAIRNLLFLAAAVACLTTASTQ
jgi:hypothetical protein